MLAMGALLAGGASIGVLLAADASSVLEVAVGVCLAIACGAGLVAAGFAAAEIWRSR